MLTEHDQDFKLMLANFSLREGMLEKCRYLVCLFSANNDSFLSVLVLRDVSYLEIVS